MIGSSGAGPGRLAWHRGDPRRNRRSLIFPAPVGSSPTADTADPARPPVAWRSALLLGLFCFAVAVIVGSDELHGLLSRYVSWAGRLIADHPVLGTAVAVLFAAASAMLAFVSTAVIVPVVVQAWGKPGAILLLWTGWILGGACAYGIGRFLGRPVVRSLVSSRALSRFEGRISKRASFGLVLLFQLALPSEVPGYVLGLLQYRFALYLGALAIAETPYAIATVYLGASFLDRQLLPFFAVGGAVLLFSVWAYYLLLKRLGQPRS